MKWDRSSNQWHWKLAGLLILQKLEIPSSFFPLTCRITLSQMGGHVAQTPDQLAYDQYGQPLIVTGKHGHQSAAWPPLGYNLIMTVPVRAEDFAQQWLPQSAAPTQIGMPQIPTVVATAVVVEPAPAQQQSMA